MADSPFIVHVAGPDDVLPAATWAEATQLAHQINTTAVEDAKEGAPYSPRVWATPYTVADAVWAGVLSQSTRIPEPGGTCTSCGIDLRYPTAVHIIDCPEPGGSVSGGAS